MTCVCFARYINSRSHCWQLFNDKETQIRALYRNSQVALQYDCLSSRLLDPFRILRLDFSQNFFQKPLINTLQT